MGQISSILLLLMTLIAEASLETLVWLTSENQIQSLSASRNVTISLAEGRHILGLSNPASGTVWVTELGLSGPSVFRVGEGEQPSRILSPEDLDGNSPLYLESLVYDQKTHNLFLTSGKAGSIFTLSTHHSSKLDPYISSSKLSPSGITIDPCSRTIYFANSNRRHPSIEAFHPDSGPGSLVSMVTANLTRPRAVTFDSFARKIYWTDLRRGMLFISRADPDGGDRELLCKIRHHDAFSLALDEDWVYWSDWTSHSVWRTGKHGSCEPEMVKSFKASKPHGIVAIPDTEPSCRDVNMDPITSIAVTPESVTLHAQEVTTIAYLDEEALSFSTDGNCSNFCFHGSCFFSEADSATCSCDEGWSGVRCETDPCHNLCLNDGECILLDGDPECLCQLGQLGDRCQVVTSISTREEDSSSRALILTLATTTGLLSLVTIVLSVSLHRTRLRPRIVRKRFISVAAPGSEDRGNKKPKTNASGCGGLPVNDGLQLDIENCCNMSLCETPCFEPPHQASSVPKTKKGRILRGGDGDDKRRLLANCDYEDED